MDLFVKFHGHLCKKPCDYNRMKSLAAVPEVATQNSQPQTMGSQVLFDKGDVLHVRPEFWADWQSWPMVQGCGVRDNP